jgi:hypothetical protein
MFKTAALPEISFGSFKPFDFVQKCAETSTQSGSRSVFAVGVDFAVSNADSVSPEKESGPSAADGLQSVVDDIAYQFWACGKCLSMGHDTTACTNQIRCKGYFHYGHIKKNCFGKKEKKGKVWVPKTPRQTNCLEPCAEKSPSTVSSPKAPISTPLSAPPETPPPPPLPSERLCRGFAMATSELDPVRFIPLGHQIIDGGDTRLPRTFYNPSVHPPQRHGAFCVAALLPPQPPRHEAHWREKVCLFIIIHLERAVESVSPCIFGIGMYELRSPAALSALV